MAATRLRWSFLQLDGLKADAQLETAVSMGSNSNIHTVNIPRATTSTAAAAGAAGAAAGAAGAAAGAAGAAGAGAAGAVATVVKSSPNVRTLNGDTAVAPAAPTVRRKSRKRRREERYPQPQQHPHPHPPLPLPLVLVRRSSISGASTSGASTSGASGARSIGDENDPLIGVPTDQAAAMTGRWDVSITAV